MKEVIFEDEQGKKHRVLLRDVDPEDLAQEIGIPLEVEVDLDEILEAAKVSLHNLLVERRIYTLEDVMQAQGGLANAVNLSVYNPLINQFKEKSRRR